MPFCFEVGPQELRTEKCAAKGNGINDPPSSHLPALALLSFGVFGDRFQFQGHFSRPNLHGTRQRSRDLVP